MDLNRRANDLFRSFILLPDLGGLGDLCGYASTATICVPSRVPPYNLSAPGLRFWFVIFHSQRLLRK